MLFVGHSSVILTSMVFHDVKNNQYCEQQPESDMQNTMNVNKRKKERLKVVLTLVEAEVMSSLCVGLNEELTQG